MALPAGRYGVTKNQLLKIKKLPMNTIKLIEELTEKYDLLGTAAFKNSTSVVTDSNDLVESGAVYTALQGKADNSVIGTVEDGATASQAYAVGSHAIRNGAFITWKNAKAQGETINDASDYDSGDVAEALSGNPSTAISTTGYTQSNYELVSSECIKKNGKVFIVANFKVLSTTSAYTSVAKLPDFAKPPLRLSTTSVSYDGGFDGVPLQFDITTAGVINLRGGVNNMRYPLILSY